MADEEIPLAIPTPLKTLLEDDCFLIQRRSKLVHLPVEVTVEAILKDYYYSVEGTAEDINLQLLAEVLDGIKIYFDFSLADHLLYSPEKEQHQILGVLNPVLPKKAPPVEAESEVLTSNKCLPSQVYGAIHLLRLFTKMPHFLFCAQLPASSVQILHRHFRDLIKYISSRRQELFHEDNYYDDDIPTDSNHNTTPTPQQSLAQQ